MSLRIETLFCLIAAVAFSCAIDAAIAQTSPNPQPATATAPNTMPVTVSNGQGGTTTVNMPIVDDSGSQTIVQAPNGTTIAVDGNGRIRGEAEKNTGKDKDKAQWKIKKLKDPEAFLAAAPDIKLPAIPACFPDQATKHALVEELWSLSRDAYWDRMDAMPNESGAGGCPRQK